MSHFSHITFTSTDAQVKEVLLEIQQLNTNSQLVFCTEQYSYTDATMRANHPDGPKRDTFREYQHVHASSNQIKIGLFTTPVESWVRINKTDEEGLKGWEKGNWHAWVGVYRPHEMDGKRGSGKELIIWDSDWNGKNWSEKVAGQGAWYDYWTGKVTWSKKRKRKMANIVTVWAGGEGNDGEKYLQLALEWMRKVAIGEVDVTGDMEKYGMKQVL